MANIVVIGAGASGLVSAIILTRNGHKVTIIEKQDRVGKKILATGNGRCNITNVSLNPKNFHSNYTGDVFFPVKTFDYNKTIDFFGQLGIIPLVENNKVYPLSEQATSVLDALRLEIEYLKVNVILGTSIINIKIIDDKFILKSEDMSTYNADKIVVATGGLAGVKEDYSMYNIMKSLGHTIQPLCPTLVHVISTSSYPKSMQGIRIKANASIYVSNELKRVEYGEILFTEDGLSGPPIFQLSRVASLAYLNKQKCFITLDLFRDWAINDIVDTIYMRIGLRENITVEQLFIGWINKK